MSKIPRTARFIETVNEFAYDESQIPHTQGKVLLQPMTDGVERVITDRAVIDIKGPPQRLSVKVDDPRWHPPMGGRTR